MTIEESNAAILRRTLSAISWICGLWTALLGAAAWHAREGLAFDPRFFFLHAALLGLAGAMLWKPRRGATIVTILAAAGSIGFVIYDLSRPQGAQAALVDGAYPVLAAILLYNSRRRP